MSRYLHAKEPSILRVGFDPQRFRSLRPEEKDGVVHHLMRVLEGERSAEMEWEHYGMRVRLDPWPAR